MTFLSHTESVEGFSEMVEVFKASFLTVKLTPVDAVCFEPYHSSGNAYKFVP